MKNIQFRAKKKDNNDWVYGSLIVDFNISNSASCRIVTNKEQPYDCVSVNADTVCQQVEFECEPDIEIYELDIVRVCIDKDYTIEGHIEYILGSYCIVTDNEEDECLSLFTLGAEMSYESFEIIGQKV